MTTRSNKEERDMTEEMIRKQNPFRLGFGLMRLPKNEDGSIDIPQVCEMTDRFIAAGGTYFDTAFVYDNGASEAAFKAAVADRYPRDAYTLATKLMGWGQCQDEAFAKQELYTSLERTGAGYIDYYLLHALQRNNYENYDKFHLWDFIQEKKAEGLIRQAGFSFHADHELLDQLLTAHPEVDFVQLQINYADWENPGVESRANLEVCRKHGKPVVIMEPVKGGILADPIPEVKTLLSGAGTSSYASWAIRFCAGLDGILSVLSGMSNIAQMEDNLSYMKDFHPLSEQEMTVIREAQRLLSEDKAIPCTACHYCTKGCPMGIPIPEIFTVYNRRKGSAHFRTVREYNNVTQGKGRASDCIGCGQCEGVCPQHLPIIQLLEECRGLEA